MSGSRRSRRSPRVAGGWLGRASSPRKRLRRELPHLDARRAAHGGVGGDDRDLLPAPMLDREALEEGVGVLGPAHLERAVPLGRPFAVEHEHAARALRGDPAREQVAQLLGRAEAARVQKVEAVEEVEGRLSHRAAACASYRRSAAATLTLSDSTRPSCGIETSRSQVRRTSGRRPLPSAPRTKAMPPERSASHIGVPDSAHGACDPEIAALDLGEVAGEVRHDGDRKVLDGARPRSGRPRR